MRRGLDILHSDDIVCANAEERYARFRVCDLPVAISIMTLAKLVAVALSESRREVEKDWGRSGWR
jgi:hypothetical protein